ncbi:hypothetical protein ASALC70_02470 [Alcanivorax sp. ALC70]|nr:hypothetical protein ASALC70_02470 [Alcanivorax sp. ALC70]
MALTATIHKTELTVSDLDRDYYATHNLTVALHPSETESRMMLRLMAFALNAHQDLSFTRAFPAPRNRTCGATTRTVRWRNGLSWASPTKNVCEKRAAKPAR